MADTRFTGSVSLGSGVVKDEQVSSTAQVDSDKLQHLHKMGADFGLDITDTPVAEERIVYVVKSTDGATVRGFHALLNDTGSSTDVDFDLKKNGSSMLSAVVNITDSDTNRATKDGTLSSTSLAEGDVISISLAVTSSTGAQGPYAWVEIDELAG